MIVYAESPDKTISYMIKLDKISLVKVPEGKEPCSIIVDSKEIEISTKSAKSISTILTENKND